MPAGVYPVSRNARRITRHMVSKPGRRRFNGFSWVMSILEKMLVSESWRLLLSSNRGVGVVLVVFDEIHVSLIALARLSRCSS